MRSPLPLLRRFRIGIAAVVILVLIYALLGFLLVPKLARSAIQNQLGRDGRQLAIDRFAFNPFSLDARIEGFALNDAQGAPLLAFKTLDVNAAVFASLWQRGLVLQEVSLGSPYVSLVRGADGTINLLALLPPSKKASQPAAGAPPRIRISRFAVDEGKLDLEDEMTSAGRPQPFVTTLSPIHFDLKDFRTEQAYDNAYQFSARVASGEELDWSGEFSLQPLASSGRFALRKLQAKTIDAYLQGQLPVQLLSGVGTVEGRYQLRFDPALALDLELPSVTVQQLALGERGTATAEPPLAIAELRIAGVALSLAQRSVTVHSLEIDGAKINAQREKDGSLSLSRLLPQPPRVTVEPVVPVPRTRTKQDAQTPVAATLPPGAADASWRIGIESIKLAGGALAFDDRAVTPAVHFALDPINLGVAGYSSASDAKLKLSGDLRLNQKTRLALDGDVQLQPLGTTLNLVLQDLALAPLQPYLAPYTGLRLKSGQLGGKFQLRYATAPDTSTSLAFSGDLGVADFVAQDPLQQDFLKWRQLSLSGIDYQQTPPKLVIDRITVSAPYARVVIEEDRSLNVSQVLSPPSAAAPATKPAAATAATKPLPIRIGTISVDNGSANFADHSIKPPFATAIAGLAGRITGLSSEPASRAKLSFTGNVDKYAPVVISGEINPLAASKYADVNLSFRNMDLTTFNPYSGRFAGYNIAKGKLTTELEYKIDNRKLDAKHHVVIDQLEFGEATGSKEAVPLPVRLAVSLLKDRRGVIDIDLPVAGSLDDPSFRVGPVLWKVFVNLLTRIVTAPFAAIGHLFGGGAELSYVDFGAGSATLSADAAAKLGTLATALAERPQLRLDVPLVTAAAEDRAALAQTALAQALPPTLTADAAAKDRIKALERIYRDQFKKAPAYPDASGNKDEVAQAHSSFLEAALLQRLGPDEASLQQLAKDRAQAVQAALLANPGIVAERIFITGGTDDATTEGGMVRMALTLK